MGTYRLLTEEEKKFIAENHGSLSDRQIARKLGVPRQAVYKYRKQIPSAQNRPAETEESELAEKEKTGTTDKLFMKNISRQIPVMIFIIILAFAICLRKHTFNLPHYRGDQHHYVGLAFKLDSEGIRGYNLRGINMLTSRESPQTIILDPAPDKGHVIKSLARGGITYYDEPLHHMPFGFPYALMLSHKLFAPDEPYSLLAINDTKIIREAPPGVGLRNFRFDPEIAGKQFYSIIVPLFFSLLMIVSVYFISRTLYNNEWAALTAMFLMTISPVDILTSQKIWADDMTAGLAALGALLYLLALKKEKSLLAFAGGIACGLSVITKQLGIIVPVGIVVWHFLSNINRLFKKESFLKVLFDKNLILFALGGLLSTGYWFIKITSVYGDPLYRPHQPGLAETAKTAWFKITQSRPRHLYLLGIPYQNPLFGLAYISPLWLWLDKRQYKNHLFPVTWLAVAFFLSYRFFTGEHRYMLSAYPAFAILGAYVVNRLRTAIDRTVGFRTGTILFILALAVSALWSVPMAMETLFYNSALIMKPF
ncbi:MAG: glycosyltransferase family 39 protein [Candidatus Omnitrophota bacterium]|nr:glycosyltransferase family 39 protein [Candidatus Omnitrophota bacterium]